MVVLLYNIIIYCLSFCHIFYHSYGIKVRNDHFVFYFLKFHYIDNMSILYFCWSVVGQSVYNASLLRECITSWGGVVSNGLSFQITWNINEPMLCNKETNKDGVLVGLWQYLSSVYSFLLSISFKNPLPCGANLYMNVHIYI